ncbi:hypothetical protein [Gordonia sp. NPDC003376]
MTSRHRTGTPVDVTILRAMLRDTSVVEMVAAALSAFGDTLGVPIDGEQFVYDIKRDLEEL